MICLFSFVAKPIQMTLTNNWCAQRRDRRLNGQRPITADTALRLGLFFGMEPRFWLNLQSEYDIRVADRELRAKLSPRIRVFQAVAA